MTIVLSLYIGFIQKNIFTQFGSVYCVGNYLCLDSLVNFIYPSIIIFAAPVNMDDFLGYTYTFGQKD